MNKKIAQLAALLLCLAMVLTACGGSDTSSAAPAESTAEPASQAPAQTPAESTADTAPAASGGTISVAICNNPQMLQLGQLTPKFQEASGITVNIENIPENDLRQKLTVHASTGGGQYDIVNIGNFEAPFWATNGWLENLKPMMDAMSDEDKAAYDYEDFIPAMRDALTKDGDPYALPTYGEASMLFFNQKVMDDAGITVPDEPTWDEVYEIAKQVHDPDNGFYGITMRGKPGWGMNGAVFGSMLHSFGGVWFDMDWKADYTTQEWKNATEMYKKLLVDVGQPDILNYGYNEANQLFAQGKAAMFYDATSHAESLHTEGNAIYNNTGYRPSPKDKKHADWLWMWCLGIDPNSKNKEDSFQYIIWATGSGYRDVVLQELDWSKVFGGVRTSVYENADYQQMAPFAEPVLEAISTVDSLNPGVVPTPYKGNQFCGMPEFMSWGDTVTQYLADYVVGNISYEDFIQKSQDVANQEAIDGGYQS